MSATFDTAEAAARQFDRMMASASRTMPTARPGAEADDPMTVIEAKGWYISFGPADVEAVMTEMEVGAVCGICRKARCVKRTNES